MAEDIPDAGVGAPAAGTADADPAAPVPME